MCRDNQVFLVGEKDPLMMSRKIAHIEGDSFT